MEEAEEAEEEEEGGGGKKVGFARRGGAICGEFELRDVWGCRVTVVACLCFPVPVDACAIDM